MATDAQMAQRKKDLLAAEIEARRKAAEYTMGLLAGFDPNDPVVRDSLMPPDPTWQGIGRQEVPGEDRTILDRLNTPMPDPRRVRFQPPVDVPKDDRKRLEIDLESGNVVPALEPVTSRVMPSVPPPMRGREPTTPVYLPEYDQLRKAKAIAAEREKILSQTGTVLDERGELLDKKGSLIEQIAALQGQGTPIDSAGAAVPTALIPRADPTQQQPTRPYWDSIESIYGPNVRARVGDARADEMEMDRFGPAVTPGAVTRAPTTQRKTSSEAVDVLSQINRKKNILRAISSIWGTKDNSKSYETSALAKYGQQLTNRGLAQLTDADFESTRGFLQAATKAGIPLKQTLEIIKSGAVGDKDGTPKADAKQQYTDANGDPHLGKISWVDGELKYLTRDGKPVPVDWVLDTSPTQTTSIHVGAEKPDIAIKKAMIKRSSMLMQDARKYWLDEDGRLREELDHWDALGWVGPARTTKLKMARALSIALRLESGAAIGEDERTQFYDLFMPNIKDWVSGDREAVIVDKFDDFQKYIEMIVEMIDPEWSDPDKREVFREILEKAKDERTRNQALDMD